jgi:hypothetical protein
MTASFGVLSSHSLHFETVRRSLPALFQVGVAFLGVYYLAEVRFGGQGSPYLVVIPSDSPSFFGYPVAGLIADVGLLILSFAVTLLLGVYARYLRRLYGKKA